MLACSAPSSSGLYGPYRPADAGSGGQSSTGGSSSEGGSSGNPGDAGLDGSAESGTSSLGGGGTGGSPSGGMGGNADAGRQDAGGTPDAGGDAGAQCGGTLLDGICWYLGALDQSCNQVCASRAGFNPAAIPVVGTPAQGGTLENCSALLQALLGNDDEAVVEGTQVAGAGVGCHLFDASAGSRWWLTTPDFSPDVGIVGGQIVCGCNG